MQFWWWVAPWCSSTQSTVSLKILRTDSVRKSSHHGSAYHTVHRWNLYGGSVMTWQWYSLALCNLVQCYNPFTCLFGWAVLSFWLSCLVLLVFAQLLTIKCLVYFGTHLRDIISKVWCTVHWKNWALNAETVRMTLESYAPYVGFRISCVQSNIVMLL